MVDFRYGPVELYLIGFDGPRPDAGAAAALLELVDGGLVRLLDLVVLTKDLDGTVTVNEIDEIDEGFGFQGFTPDVAGLAGQDDVEELAELVAPGTSAAVVTIELLFAKRLAERLASAGAVVLSNERIPAPVVNALIDAAESDVLEEGERS